MIPVRDIRPVREGLNDLYRWFDFKERTGHDPIRFPMRYKRKRDIEAAAFIAASFAYGRVGLFVPVIAKVLKVMGNSPSDFLRDFNVNKRRNLFAGVRYRFNDTDDIVSLLYIISVLLSRHGSIENAFGRFYRKEDSNTGSALSGIMDYILEIDTSRVYGRNIRPRGLLQFFPSPRKGSACKRANLFLRWMVRDRDIDFGIWKGIPKNRLVIPLDTHVAQASRRLGLTERKSADWKTAIEVTEALKKIDPEDPLKYDFVLCHGHMARLLQRFESCEIKQ